VKINGEMHYLWRAVDHEGEVLESVVTRTRDRKATLKFLRKSMKRHGRPETIVTDRLRSYGAARKAWVAAMTARWVAGLTIGPRNHTCRSAACITYRSSLQCMPRSTTATQRSAISKIATPMSDPRRRPRRVARPSRCVTGRVGKGNGAWFAFVWQHRQSSLNSSISRRAVGSTADAVERPGRGSAPRAGCGFRLSQAGQHVGSGP
jgi:hypothetical protein